MKSPIFALLRRLAWRRWREEPFRHGLTILGVALGVAVYLAIVLANASAVRAFRNSLDAVAGKTHLQVAGGDAGIPEELFLRIRDDPGVRHAAPVVQIAAWVRKLRPGGERWGRGTRSQGRGILLLGLDSLGDSKFRSDEAERKLALEESLSRLADPEGIFLTRRLAEEMGVGEDDYIQLDAFGRHRFRVRGLLKPKGLAEAMEGRLAIMDIGVAQEAFHRVGRLDRIDVILKNPGRLEEVRRALQGRLPPGVVVERPVRRGEDVDRMLASFRLNLSVLSVIALFVGFFLVFNTMSASAVRRRAEVGMLRSVGMTGRGVAVLFSVEAGLIGLIGSILGVGLGWLLARAALGAVTRTIRNLYAFLYVSEVDAPPALLAGGLLLGTGVALVSGLLPALTASKTPPAVGTRDPGGASGAERGFLAGTFGGGILAAAISYFLAQLPPWGGVPLFGYLAAGAAVVSMVLLAPLAVAAAAAALRRFRRGGRLFWLAAHGLGRHPRRNAVTVATLATAIAMLTSLVVMIESFRGTVADWTGKTLRADFYAAPAARFIKGSKANFPAGVAEKVGRLESVAAVGPYRALRLPWRGGRVELKAWDFDVFAERGRLLFLEGDSKEILKKAKNLGEAVVTETFSLRFGVGRGGQVRLPTPEGEVSFRVAGVFYDYSTGGGSIVIDSGHFRRLWKDDRLSSMGVYLAEGADPVRAGREIEGLLEKDMVLISNRALRRRVLDIFDQTFAITYALEGIALLVAVLGVATGLSSNVLERRREIGTLRAAGLTERGVASSVMGEAGLVGALSAALGAAGGLGLAAILIYVINKQSFGWTIRFSLPYFRVAQYLAVTMAAALVSGFFPARAAAKGEIALAVREE